MQQPVVYLKASSPRRSTVKAPKSDNERFGDFVRDHNKTVLTLLGHIEDLRNRVRKLERNR